MTLQERTIESAPRPTAPAVPPASASLQASRDEGQRFLDAGDDAIRQALSTDSRQFNAAMEQEGGQ